MKFDIRVPNDVNLTKISELCTFTQGVQIPSSETFQEPEEGLIRYIYIRDLFSDDYIQYVEDKYPTKILSLTDIVMVNTGATAGDVYRGKHGVLCNNAFRIKIKHNSTNRLNQEYLWYFLNSHIKTRYLRRLFNTAGQPHVGHSNVAQLPIPMFPIEEQRAIADILGTWDEAIALTESLISALEVRKKGLMQKLLTGEVRFSEFDGEWEIKKIGRMAKLTAGGTPSTRKEEYWENGNVRWMKSGDIHLKQIFDVDGRISELGLNNSSAKMLPKNSVLVALAGQGKTRGTIAVNKVELSTNQSVAAIIPNPEIVNYAYLFLNLDSRYEELRRLSTGDGGRGGLNLKLLKNIKLPLPQLDEQEFIADVLLKCDEEMTILSDINLELQQQKKGLMQQLLTGQVRVQI